MAYNCEVFCRVLTCLHFQLCDCKLLCISFNEKTNVNKLSVKRTKTKPKLLNNAFF